MWLQILLLTYTVKYLSLKGKTQKYEDIIRVAVKVKNGKLNSNKSQDNINSKIEIRTKDLGNYYNHNALEEYYSRNVKKYLEQNHFIG